METTITILGLYRGYIGIMENKMEATIILLGLYRCCVGIMGNKKETTHGNSLAPTCFDEKTTAHTLGTSDSLQLAQLETVSLTSLRSLDYNGKEHGNYDHQSYRGYLGVI